MTEDRTQGTVNEIKGKAKEAWGDATDDRSTEAEGHVDQAQGQGQQGVGDIKDALTGKDRDENR